MGSTTNNWANGVTADYSVTPTDWSLGLPSAGSAAVIRNGTVQMTGGDKLPANLTFNVGALKNSLWVASTSNIQVIDATLPLGLVINNEMTGGTLYLGGNTSEYGSQIIANGSVTSYATINIHAGDVENIAVAPDSSGVKGYFNNMGVINATGSGANHAGLGFIPATSAAVTANYGVINLNDAFFVAATPDASTGASGQIAMSGGSMAMLVADLQHANFTISDAAETLAIGQNPGGVLNGTGAAAEYAYGGTISGFVSGDVIGLMESGSAATLASVSYSAGGLTIKDANGNVLGQLNIPKVSATDSFILTQQPTGSDWTGYTSQYNVSLADVLTSGAAGDINSAAIYVGGVTPTAGGVVDIGVGKATIVGTTKNETPLPSTIVIGAAPDPTTGSSSSNLAITDESLGAGMTIDATKLGGIYINNTSTSMLAGIGAYGAVNFAGTINVGAGDALSIGLAGDTTASSGCLNNTGTINVIGTASNLAFMQVKQGTLTVPAGIGFAAFGTVNLSEANFFAKASDSGSGSTAKGGTFNLSNNSSLNIFNNAVFSAAVINFQDASDRLMIGQVNGGYKFGGAINGFQSGDVIGLFSNTTSAALPSYLTYDSSTGLLTIHAASGTSVGSLHLVGNYVTAGFSLSSAITSAGITNSGYASEYKITYSMPDVWKGGVIGAFDAPGNWSSGAMPQSGGVAILQAGSINIDTSQFVSAPLTLDVGTLVATVGSPSQSNINVIQNYLPTGLTINNLGAGGSISQAGVAGSVVESALNIVNFSNFDATLNVGAGDAELISVQSTNSGPAFFDNQGQINLGGTANNYAVAIVSSVGANSAANSVFYGEIALSYGFLDAAVSDKPVAGVATSPAFIDLSNKSAFFAAASLQNTNVRFDDGGDQMYLAPLGAGATTYQFGGSIYGFQQGDAITLEATSSSAIPTSISYDVTHQMLDIYGKSGLIGQVHVVGNYAANSFSLGKVTAPTLPPTLTSLYSYSGQYTITVTPLPYTWTSGAVADFTTSADWTGGAPPNGASTAPTIATINQGNVQIAATDTAPKNITFDVGAISFNVQPTSTPTSTPTSILTVTDKSLAASVTINATMAGGSAGSGNGGDYYLSGLNVNGQVNFAGTINVGGDDAEVVTLSPSAAANPGYFDNTGVINVIGTALGQAYMLVHQGVASAGATQAGYASYGSVNLNQGVFLAEAADSAANGGNFVLHNDSSLYVVNTVFSSASVTFADATSKLLLGETSANSYDDYGPIYGLQSGDSIGLLENGTSATPASLSYSNGVLSVLNASKGVIGQIAISSPSSGAPFTTASFVLLPPSTPTGPKLGFSSEVDIQLGTTLASLAVDPKAPYQNSPYNIGKLSNATWQRALVEVQTNASVNNGGALNVDAAAAATGGSALVVEGALTVNAGGVLNIGVNSPGMTASTVVSAASLTNAGSINIASGGADAALIVNSAVGMGGQTGVLTGAVTLTGNAQIAFNGGNLTTIGANGALTLSGVKAEFASQFNGQIGGSATGNLAAINGAVDIENGNLFFTNSALTNSGQIKLDFTKGSGGSSFSVGGALANSSSGVIDIGNAAMTTGAWLGVNGLQNAGVIQLTGSPTVAWATLQLNNNGQNSGLIEGAGTILANAGDQLTNNIGGTIDANLSGAWLTINASAPMLNNGVLEADGGTLDVRGSVSGAGSAVIKNNGTMDCESGFNGNVQFAGAGALILAQNAYAGMTLTGLAVADSITIGNAHLTSAVYTYKGGNTGTLALLNGTTTVETLTLAGNYTGSAFILSPTTSGGTSVSLSGASGMGPFTVAGFLTSKTSIDQQSRAVGISDTAANVAANIDGLNADANVKSITLSDGATPTLNLTAAQALNDSSALGEITNTIFSIDINGVITNIIGGGGPGGLLAVGGGKTINFGSVTGSSARLYNTAGNADTVKGSHDSVSLTNAQATVTGDSNLFNFSGTNTLTVSGASEAFIFQTSIGNDTIYGFAPTDSIQLSKADFGNWSTLLSHTSQSGADTLIKFDATDTITLHGVTASSLTSSQFHFM